MKKSIVVFTLMAVLFTGLLPLQSVSAQFQQGGVDHPGEWHVGEGLKVGDYFSYELCFVNYKDCRDFEMDMWIEKEIRVGTEEKWLAQVVVYDGNKIVRGNIELGQVAPEPTGGTTNLAEYRDAFKSSIVWLSAFANSIDTKRFDAVSWGKIANIGGEQILPKEILPNGLTVRGGYFDEVILIGWRTGGANSEVYVVDNFPFPIQASTWVHVSEGIPPQEYRFELLDYRQGITEDPFEGIVDSAQQLEALDCPNYDTLVTSLKKPTENYSYQVHVLYGPEFPVDGCPIKMQIKFISKFDDTAFLNQVQYDVLVRDENRELKRSLAQDEGQKFLFSPSGQSLLEFPIKEGAGTANYVIWIYGISPIHIVPSEDPDYLEVPIMISAGANTPATPPPVVRPVDPPKPDPVDPPTPDPVMAEVPPWIKTSAEFWVDGVTSDAEFVSAMQFLIEQGVLVVPSTQSGASAGDGIPSWIKTTTGFWVAGDISDDEFVNAIQFLIREGIIVIS